MRRIFLLAFSLGTFTGCHSIITVNVGAASHEELSPEIVCSVIDPQKKNQALEKCLQKDQQKEGDKHE